MVFLQLAILSHCLADFIFQSNDIVQLRKSSNLKKCLKGNIIHAIIVFSILFTFLIVGYKFETTLAYSLLIGLFHFAIDLIKNLLSLKIKSIYDRPICHQKTSFLYIILSPLYRWINSLIFIIDQILHVAVIAFIWGQTSIQSSENIINCIYLNKNSTIDILNYLIIYLYVCFGGRFFINVVISELYLQPYKNKAMNVQIIYPLEKTSASDYIGIFERFIIITLVINGAYQAIAFIFTAKSIARFRELEEKYFAQYYLVGTLFSTSLGILGGIFLKYIINK
ncbi:DUF3307 domain-containing protein [Clostridium ljungdahlii]|uniref:DUF3307 domain-containing protein n=1 Tax=Clostridium ljungdahlii TaxID=1538 RepID=A0A166RMG0_9CLOT|nr:DUF3307 domain-containing protein [Clostridium ljungdahlii]OAA90943.1 hypothetical protein WY13_01009 [Clostridium ljungdahlii]